MPNILKKLTRRRIMNMPELPTLPDNVIKLMHMLRDPDVSAPDVIDEINRDHVLVAQILKLVNSGYYSIRTHVSTVDHAVSRSPAP